MLSTAAVDETLHETLERAFGQREDAMAVVAAAGDLRDSPLLYANSAFARLHPGAASQRPHRTYGELCTLLTEPCKTAVGDLEGQVAVELPGQSVARFNAVTFYDEASAPRFRVVLHRPLASAKPSQGQGQPNLDALMDAIGSGVLVHRDFQPLFANAACARLLGLASPQEVMDQPTLLRFVPVESLDPVIASYQAVLEKGQTNPSYFVHALRANGSPFWAEVNEAPVSWRGEAAVAVSFVDATEHARARKSEALLREAIDNLSDSFILYDAEDRVVLTNRRFHSIFPFVQPQDRIAGTPMIDLVRASVAQGVVTDPALRDDNAEQWIADFIEGRRRKALSLTEDTWPDGRWDLVKEQRLESGGFVSVRTDITDRKRAEFALKDQESRLEEALAERTKHLEAVLANIAQGVIVLDPELRVVLTNPGLHEIVGYPAELGKPGTHVEALIRNRLEHDLFLPGEEESSDDIETLVERRLQAYRDLTRERFQHPFPNGRHVEIHREKLPDGSIICTFSDITDRVEAEQELQRQREALYQREKLSALGMLLAGVAHELNNPLSVVLGQSALMESLAPDKQQQDRAGRIRTAAERCAKIIKTFLAMARDAPASRGPLSLNDLVEQARDFVDYQLRRAGIEVVQDLAPDLPQVLGDADQLNQVVVNLLINAVQAMEAQQTPRRIVIKTALLPQTGEVEMQVSDNGPGMPEEVRRRVFDPFFTTKPAGVGTGIGLSVCHGMVTAHGGSITVDEAPGGGARFKVRLPQAPQAEEPLRKPDDGAAATGEGRVLIVDDEAEICEMVAEFLGAIGLSADFVTDARDALARLDSHAYDAVLCDLRMPNMDGRMLYREATRRRPEYRDRFIFATGDLLSDSSRRFLEQSGRICLEKPLLPDQVRQVVRQVVERPRRGPR